MREREGERGGGGERVCVCVCVCERDTHKGGGHITGKNGGTERTWREMEMNGLSGFYSFRCTTSATK